MTQKICLEDQLFKMFQQNLAERWKDSLNEFAHNHGGNSGDYLKALASAWYNDTFTTGSLQKGIKTKQDVERLLQRGIVCPDGKTRKYNIDYNANFDGVDIYSDDYYEHGDHDDTIDSRTGQKWGPYEFITFHDSHLDEGWSQKYKKSINCSHPKGFSQKAHCAGKKKHNESHEVMEMTCPDCGMCQSHGTLNEIKKGAKDSNGFTKCWPGKHAEGTKKGKNGKPVRNCVPNESMAEAMNKNDLLGNVAKDLNTQFKKAKSGKLKSDGKDFTKGDHWQGAKPGDYGYTGYQGHGMPTDKAERDRIRADKKKGVAEGLNEFAPDGFNGGDDGERFSPEIAKMAQEDGFTKGASLADGATLKQAITINHWHSQHDGMYKQYFAKGFKAGRMNKIRHSNKQYNLNLKLMKDGSIRHGEQGVAEDWNKVNHHDKTNGLSQKAVNAYRRENPGSKLKTAVTTKPSKLKAGSKDAKRRKSFCARMSGNKGPMKKPNGKPTPKALALRRWNCESVEEMQELIRLAEQHLDTLFEKSATLPNNYPFAGRAVGQKAGKAGQLKGTDAGKLGGKQPAQGKLVGGA